MASPSPTNKDLWEKIQKLVKGEIASFRYKDKKIEGPRQGKGFKVFPSSYANQWAAKLYKSLGGKWKAGASYLNKLEAQYNRFVWTPTQVHTKLCEVIPVINKKMPKGIFLQATVELHDDVPVVRVLLGPNDPYTAERLGSFAFYSTSRGMEWFVKQQRKNPTPPFEPHQGTVVVTYFCDVDPQKGEVFIGQINLNDPVEAWCDLLSKAPCPAFDMVYNHKATDSWQYKVED